MHIIEAHLVNRALERLAAGDSNERNLDNRNDIFLDDDGHVRTRDGWRHKTPPFLSGTGLEIGSPAYHRACIAFAADNAARRMDGRPYLDPTASRA